MISTLSADGSFVTRIAIANPWLFGPMLKDKVAATPAGAALLRTTIAPNMVRPRAAPSASGRMPPAPLATRHASRSPP